MSTIGGGAAAGANAGAGAGGTSNLVRSFGHTQFLAMSVSLAVPALSPQYVAMCEGFK